MIRRAFTMRLKPGALAEYRKRHDEIWPELVAEIEKSGIATMTTFEADPVLFLYSEITDEQAWDRLWEGELHMRWGEAFEHLMDIREDGIVESGDLREIFHLETGASRG
jgi:L-rhamnose mutarotase